jgi:hypothetical protein
MARKNNGNSILKVFIMDAAGVGCLLLVPILGPLPGPGGIPLILAGFGFLAVNHDWADNAIHYVKKNSENLLKNFFPDKPLIKWGWDIYSVALLGFGLWLNLTVDGWFLKGLSYGLMASASTIFMLNRQRLDWLDKQLRRTGKR